MTTSESSRNVLLIEDDSFISTSFADKLTEKGFTAFPVDTTQKAWEVLRTHPIHFILVDIMLPQEDGLTFVEKLKKEKMYQSIPVMVLSNLGNEETIASARKLGVVDYVVKAEKTPEEIVEKISQYLQQ